MKIAKTARSDVNKANDHAGLTSREASSVAVAHGAPDSVIPNKYDIANKLRLSMQAGCSAKSTRADKILIIEDKVGDKRLIQECIREIAANRYEFEFADTIKEACNLILKMALDAIIIDYQLPDGTATDLLSLKVTRDDVPVIVLTGSADKDFDIEVLASGAADCIPKSDLNPTLLERIVRYSIEKTRANAVLKNQALRDQLTGLYNRSAIKTLLPDFLRQAKFKNERAYLLSIDIAKFQSINDVFGQPAGDEVLLQIGALIEDATRQSDFVARSGADQFVVLLTGLDDEIAHIPVARLLENVNRSLSLQEMDISLNTRVGISLYPDDAEDAEQLFRNAELALAKCKKTEAKFETFNCKLLEDHDKRLQLERDLTSALDRDEFVLHFQPKFDTNTKCVTGAEALLRWRHPSKGMTWPHEFIDIAEETGDIVSIGAWAMKEACKKGAEWQRQLGRPFTMAVNISIMQLLNKNFVDETLTAIEESGITIEDFELEITETLAMKNFSQALTKIKQLKKFGVSISLDDFGTGYSSLGRLRQLPVDKLKIDRSLIKNVGGAHFDSALAKSVILLAKNLKLVTIAEGVETEEQFNFLRRAGCNEVQGFLFSKPLAEDDFVQNFVIPASGASAAVA